MNLKGWIRYILNHKKLLRHCYLSECENNQEDLCLLDGKEMWLCNQKLIEIENEQS